MKRDEIPGMIARIRSMWSLRRGVCVKLNNKTGDTVYRICCGPLLNPYLVAERCNVWDSAGNLVYQGPLEASMLKGVSLRAIAELVYYSVERQEPLRTQKC